MVSSECIVEAYIMGVSGEQLKINRRLLTYLDLEALEERLVDDVRARLHLHRGEHTEVGEERHVLGRVIHLQCLVHDLSIINDTCDAVPRGRCAEWASRAWWPPRPTLASSCCR